MRYRITHITRYQYSDPVAVCHNLCRLTPRNDQRQTRLAYELAIDPEPTDLVQRTDMFGNAVEYFSIQQPHHGLTLSVATEVELATPGQRPPGVEWESVAAGLAGQQSAGHDPPYLYAFPSALIPTSPALRAYAAESFMPRRPVIAALRDLTQRVQRDFKYDPRATTVSTPVEEVFERRAGVCQDFAHVQIACLRSLGMAARYVSGYLRTLPPPGKPRLVGVDASHAWLSLYCGADGWVDADPTNAILPGADHVTLAHGRDYSDVCPVQGVYVGGGGHTMSVAVDVAPLA